LRQHTTLKKVLIITYYWPPSGGAGVQRWLKFVKYLREFGWEPVVYTADNPEYPIIDASFEKDIPKGITILKQPIWEPYQLYKKLIGQKKEERVVSGFLQEKGRKTWAQNLSLWLRGNVFIPDARRFWIKPSVKFLNNWLENNKVDAIVSTGPPHSMHLIAEGVHRKTNLPWLADFRDPWTNIDFADDLNMTSYAKKKNARLEKLVVNRASIITVVSEVMQQEFKALTNKRVEVITNGFDPDDFRIDNSLLVNDGKFSIVHTGSLNNRRNQPALWQAISELRTENKEFEKNCVIRLIGKNDVSIKESLQQFNLLQCTYFVDYLPHNEIIAQQKSASVLLLSINNYGEAESGFFTPKATLTGKLFEYLAASKPILMIGPADGQAADVVRNSGGAVFGFNDTEAIKIGLIQLFNSRNVKFDTASINQYSRKELTRKMSLLLNEISISSG
jgi:glycosyltransferase involved in cell wall biosynthesis